MTPLGEKPVEIEKNNEPGPLNFSFLKNQGIDLIQQLSGKSWTDFNLHDPGVTILECLCYAITDLAYRTSFPITDIVTQENGVIDREKNSFFRKEEILSTNPVTISDFRKIVIDLVPEVCNVWLKPVLSSYSRAYIKGLYQVIIQPNADIAGRMEEQTDNEKQQIKKEIEQKVRKVLVSYRNTGEDFETYKVLEPQAVYINEAEIVIKRNTPPEFLLANICHTLETTINPPIKFSTEQELVPVCTIDEIYAGPLLQNGIISDLELNENEHKNINISDLVRAVSQIEGIVDVKKLRVFDYKNNEYSDVITVKEGFFPYAHLRAPSPQIKLYNENYLIPVNIHGFQNELQKLRHSVRLKHKTNIENNSTHPLISGVYRGLQEYTSIQTLFPGVYNIGKEELEKWHSNKTLALAKQLKAYLMFFEQMLVNYLSQLANIDNLLSPNLSEDSASTYYPQMLRSVPGAKDIIRNFSKVNGVRFDSNEEFEFNKWFSSITETDKTYTDRKKDFMNHMLARFNIFLNKYPVTLYRFYYKKENSGKRIDFELEWKASILKNIIEFTNNRARAFDYFEQIQDQETKPGLEKNIALLLHITNKSKRKLSDVFVEYKKNLDIKEKKDLRFLEETNRSTESAEAQYSYSGELLLTDEAVKNLEGIEESEGITLTENASFRKHDISLFQFGIDRNNYRIGHYSINGKKEVITLYKNPSKDKWSIISKHSDIPAALTALKKTIEFLIKISTESEGYHLIEHILLRPSLNSKSFGFNFYDEEDKILLKGKTWQTFHEREEAISAIIEAVRNEAQEAEEDKRHINYLKLMKVLLNKNANFHSYHNQFEQRFEEPVEFIKMYKSIEDDVKKVADNVILLNKNKNSGSPKFENLIRSKDVIKEEFFHFHVTAVFPLWPARFQDMGFREFAVNLFREECAAHLRINILWLNMQQMKEFEGIYFSWLHTLKENTDNPNRIKHSSDLVSFLKKHRPFE